LRKEDNLFASTKQLIETHIEHLIVKAAQHGENESFHEMTSDGLLNVVTEFADNLERLKHCIIYELVQSTKLQIILAGEKGAYDKLIPCSQEIIQLGKADMSNKDFS
jgi:hypothetical protein